MGGMFSVDRQDMHIEPGQPNVNSKHQSRLPWFLVALIAATLALVVSFGVKVGLLSQRNLLSDAQLPKFAAQPAESTTVDQASSLMTDSILSIVQGYYVDPKRVENRELIETALAAMATNPRVHIGSSPGAAWVQIDDGEKKFFLLKKAAGYQDVVDILVAMARMIDDAGVPPAAGEMPEKNAPAVVALLNAMLAELDAHSSLLSPEAYRELRQGTEGTFGGLGVLVGIRDHLLTVIKPLPRSPAQRAGIKRNDRILSIGGVFTYGFSLDDLVEYMRGDPGSRVHLSLLRPGAQAPTDLLLKREVIHVDSVTSEEITQNGMKALHLTIDSFASRTSREVLTAIKRFKAKHGGVIHGLVLDLRSNPGGLLDQAVQVADLFLESGVIVSTKGRHEEIEKAGSGFDEVGFPIVVLIDGDSASASEIVAGALQDHQRAVVVGQPSFGKGSVQTVFELPGDRALKLTIARYFTPAGRSIQNVGIIPDVWMQPVAKSESNDNLFGPSRYKNERFLKNRLDNSDTSAALEQRQPSRKSYYLTSAMKEATEEDVVRGPDREMEFALKIIDRVRSTYGDHPPRASARASHWLGLAGPSIKDAANALDRETTNWLAKTHKIKWTPANAVQAPIMPNIRLDIGNNRPQIITPGETVNITWTITNLEKVPVNRASVFVRSEAPGFDTREILVGDLPAASMKTGVVQVAVPNNFAPGSLAIRIGVAVDAWPVRGATADYSLQIEDTPKARLSAVATLVEDLSGHVVGVLEARERARIRVDLRNDGDIDAVDLDVKLLNLSGTQVQLEQDSLAIDELSVGEEKHVYFDIKGAKTIVTSEMSFGMSVEGPEVSVPLRQRFAIKSLPTADLSAKPVRVMSH